MRSFGALTPEERAEYGGIVRLNDLFNSIHLQVGRRASVVKLILPSHPRHSTGRCPTA